MKMSIEFHKKCLANMRINLEVEEKHLQIMQLRVTNLKANVQHLSRQIDIAAETGKDGFDPERFLKGK